MFEIALQISSFFLKYTQNFSFVLVTKKLGPIGKINDKKFTGLGHNNGGVPTNHLVNIR